MLSGELQPRCSRSPSAAFGKGLRIMICEYFHFINVSNCLAAARIYYGALVTLVDRRYSTIAVTESPIFDAA